MGRDVLLNARLFLVVLHDLPKALAGHAFAADVDEKRLFIRHQDHLRPNQCDVVAQRLDRCGIHGDKSLTVAARAANDPGDQVYIGNIEVDELGHADACRIKKLQHRLIPVALGVYALRLLQQKLDLLAAQNLRQLLCALVRDQTLGRVDRDELFDEQMRIQTFDGGDGA